MVVAFACCSFSLILSSKQFNKRKNIERIDATAGWGEQGNPMDLFLLISVLQAIFLLAERFGKLICPWKESESVTGK